MAVPAVGVRDSDALLVAILPSVESGAGALEASLGDGRSEMRFIDLSQGGGDGFAAGRTIVLEVPRTVAEARGLSPWFLHGATLRSGRATMIALLLIGARIVAPDLTRVDAELLEGTVLRLLALAAQGCGRGQPCASGGANASTRTRYFVDTEFQPADLSVSRLCRHLSISRSTLYRLFREEGGVLAYIRRRRLEAVRRDLEDPVITDPVYLLAEKHGFVDSSHLNRHFRARYGLTPGDWRARRG